MTQAGDPASIVERVIAAGDLAHLDPLDRVTYYRERCESLGLNPLTEPFAYIMLNSKLKLYATKNATEQLRRIHQVSLTIVARERHDDLYVVTARATMPDGRTDESIGAVSIAGLKGDALANALMKTETKAKRRVTLSVCGLGSLDETEVDTIAGAERVALDQTGEIVRQALPAPATTPRQLSAKRETPTNQPEPAPRFNPEGLVTWLAARWAESAERDPDAAAALVSRETTEELRGQLRTAGLTNGQPLQVVRYLVGNDLLEWPDLTEAYAEPLHRWATSGKAPRQVPILVGAAKTWLARQAERRALAESGVADVV